MTEEKKALVEEMIRFEAESDSHISFPCKIYNGDTWIDDLFYYSDDEELIDAWNEYEDEYGSEKAYEYYCNVLEMEGVISDWEWDYAHQKITLKIVER